MTRPLDDEAFDLINAALDGDVDAAARARAEELYASRPEVAEEAALLRAIRATTLDLGLENAPPILRHRIRAATHAEGRGGVPPSVAPPLRARWAAAAAVLVALGVYWRASAPTTVEGSRLGAVSEAEKDAGASGEEAKKDELSARAPASEGRPKSSESSFQRALLAVESIRHYLPAPAPEGGDPNVIAHAHGSEVFSVGPGFRWNTEVAESADMVGNYAVFGAALNDLSKSALPSPTSEVGPSVVALALANDDLRATVAQLGSLEGGLLDAARSVDAEAASSDRDRRKDEAPTRLGGAPEAASAPAPKKVAPSAEPGDRELRRGAATGGKEKSAPTKPADAALKNVASAQVVFVSGVDVAGAVERLLAGAGADVRELPVVRAGVVDKAAAAVEDAPSRTRLIEATVRADEADALVERLKALSAGPVSTPALTTGAPSGSAGLDAKATASGFAGSTATSRPMRIVRVVVVDHSNP